MHTRVYADACIVCVCRQNVFVLFLTSLSLFQFGAYDEELNANSEDEVAEQTAALLSEEETAQLQEALAETQEDEEEEESEEEEEEVALIQVGQSTKAQVFSSSFMSEPPRTGRSVLVTPKRFRLADVLAHRPGFNRFDPTVAPHPSAERQKARIMFQHMLQFTYDRMEGYCSTRLPEKFFPYCAPMLSAYRRIAEGYVLFVLVVCCTIVCFCFVGLLFTYTILIPPFLPFLVFDMVTDLIKSACETHSARPVHI